MTYGIIDEPLLWSGCGLTSMPTKTSGAGGGAKSKPSRNTKRSTRKGNSGSDTPDAVKAQIFAMLMSGQYDHEHEIATQAGVAKSTVTKYKKLLPPEYLEQARTIKKERVGPLIVEFLETTLESLKAVNETTSDDEWIRRQDASGLAVFFGVKTDKIAKILDAIHRAPDEDEVRVTEGN